MSSALLVLPMSAMVLLTLGTLVITFRSRIQAVREGAVPPTFYKLYQGGTEPEYAVKPARHFSNLFEAPTLFYAGCLAAMVTDHGGVVAQALAWAYVGARVVHASIHLGRNQLRKRIAAYFTSWLILVGLWGYVASAVVVTAMSGR